MTRDEAIKLMLKHMPDLTKPGSTVDFYAEAGMLKLDEPKSVENRFDEAICDLAINARPTLIWDAIHRANLKIVEK